MHSTRNHVQSLDFTCNVSKILGIIPPTSNNHASKSKYSHKVYVIVLAILFVLASSLPIYHFSRFFQNFVILGLIIATAFCLAVLNISTVFGTNFANTWTRLNNSFMSVDSKLNRKSSCDKSLVRFAIITNGLYLISMLHIYFAGHEFDANFVVNLPGYVSVWYSLNVFVFIYSILTVLKNDYEHLNALVAHDENAANVKALAIILKDITEDFNDLFGWPLLFFALRGGIQLLTSIYYVLVVNVSFSSSVNTIVISIGQTFFLMLPTILLATSCGRVKAESEKTELLSYKSPSKDLRQLAPFLKSNTAKFSAAGFFDMDRRTIPAFLTTTVTYLIVLIQL